jgi:hypothetical protein
LEKDKVIQQLKETIFTQQVVFGSALTKAKGLQAFIDAQSMLYDLSNKANIEQLEGKTLKDYPEIVGPIGITWHVVTDDEIKSSWKKCPWFEIAKKLDLTDPPLCEGICKASTESKLRIIAPGFSKKIVKSLWKGDDECRWHMAKH